MSTPTTGPYYRQHDRAAHAMLDSGDFFRARFAIDRTPRPVVRDAPTLVAFCATEGCVAREVIVGMELYGETEPTKFYCPLCGKPMERREYQRTVTLLEVEPPNGANP